MTTITTLTPRQVAKMMDDNVIISVANEEYIRRGDGLAVYTNQDFGHPQQGHRRFFPYGSDEAQFPGDEPPTQLPDFPGEINWRYQLEGVSPRGEEIPELEDADYATPHRVAERIVDSFEEHDSITVDYWQVAVRHHRDSEDRMEVFLSIREPECEVSVMAWVDEDGVNRLGVFEWAITDETAGERTGSDPNLGGTIVAVVNNTLALLP